MTPKDIALNNEILRGVLGSTSHGTAIDGQDDRDEMGIFIEPPENVCGLSPVDHYIYRDQPDGVRSQPGDLDLVMYSLRKFCRLAAKGNPSVMILLWLPEYIKATEIGAQLFGMRQAFISQEAGKRFLGYLTAQKKSLTGERTQKVNRPELIEKYGFDSKFAVHALRLGYEGIELLKHRRLTLPVAEPNLGVLRAVRTGQYTYAQTLNLINLAEEHLRELVDKCELKADLDSINQFMVDAHLRHWNKGK
jgi:predicted nucleotidyltransferase